MCARWFALVFSVHVRDDIRGGNAQPLRDASKRLDRWIAQAGLDTSDVGAIEACTVREAFLSPALAFAKLAHSRAKGTEQRIPPFGHATASFVQLALSIYYE